MTLSLPPSPSDRLSVIVRYLCASVLGREMSLGQPLVMAICQRLTRITSRFAALAQRVREGTLRPLRPRTMRAVPSDRSAARAVPDGPVQVGPRLPRGFAWLLPLVPDTANYGSQLAHLLADPEMAAVISAAPGFGRLLRPMCRMLGVSPLPDALKAPPAKRRVARRRPAPAETPEPPMRPIYPKSRVVGGIEVYARGSRGGFSSA